MGCTKIGHCHQWPTKGTLIIQRCEIRCNFCNGKQASKDWKYAWFLRRHVRAVHARKGKYPNLEVDIGWDEHAPKGAKAIGRIARKESEEKVGRTFPDGALQNQNMDVDSSGNMTESTDDESMSDLDQYPPATRDELEAWITQLVDELDVLDDGFNNARQLFDPGHPSDSDPAAVQDYAQPIISDPPATKIGERHGAINFNGESCHSRSHSQTAAAKFFMDEYKPESEDNSSDRTADERPGPGPLFHEYWTNLSKEFESSGANGTVNVETWLSKSSVLPLLARSLQETY